MCGICGHVVLSPDGKADSRLVERMMKTMDHRGPDDDGIYVNGQAALGHKRLSIIDLSTGKQPISNEDGSIWVVFNGEIYNFKDLRAELISKGHSFRTHTDTEVIVHLYEEYGDNCVDSLRGMFAFAIWDERNRRLLLARDRVGIKPVYYSVDSERLVFGSEIKAVISDPTVKRDIDPEAIDRFLTFMYVPGEHTMIRDVKKLAPGHMLVSEGGKVNIKQYWDLTFAPQPVDISSAKADLVNLLADTVRDHMISDVPVGVLLSGGVDSTALLSFVVEATDKEVETFTVGFEDQNFADERPYARLAAKTFGSRHHEITISAQEFMDFLPKYVWYMEEPICEPPAVALYYVSKLASAHVKVLLSGEGGDEAFGGYQNYRNFLWLERAKKLGWPVTVGLASVMGQVGRVCSLEKLKKYSSLMRIPIKDYYYGRTWNPLSPLHQLRSHNASPNATRSPLANGSAKLIHDLFAKVSDDAVLNQMLYVDSKTWLPDDLLVKADKMTMANSVELRVPFLDHRLLEFAARLPANAKIRGITTKYILKKAFSGRIPSAILDRPKTGFPVPYDTWLNKQPGKPLWDILHDRRMIERGYFDRKRIGKFIADAEAQGTFAPEVFSLVTLELWHRRFIDSYSEIAH